MTKRILLFVILAAILSACGAPATQIPVPFIEELTSTPIGEPANLSPLAVQASPTNIETDTPIPTEAPTVTPAPTSTDTPLPPLVLPTEAINAPALGAWTGLPTYPGDSEPGLMYQLAYDPNIWAQTQGDYGEPVLAERQIQYCTISTWAGRGLPNGWMVTHDSVQLGNLFYDKGTASLNGQPQFVTYSGGDGKIQTGFQVTFKDQQDLCVTAAEALLSTLRSIEATPTITPTSTP